MSLGNAYTWKVFPHPLHDIALDERRTPQRVCRLHLPTGEEVFCSQPLVGLTIAGTSR